MACIEIQQVGLIRVRKCTICAPRQAQGQQPACTEACPVEAGIFGERPDLLSEAEKRLREEPAKYIQHVYGKEEVGGTSVLYHSAVPFGQLGLPTNLPRDPMPLLTYRVFSKIPDLGRDGGGAVARPEQRRAIGPA
jgi:formate dehydrogenase iron-sulfur subunit